MTRGDRILKVVATVAAAIPGGLVAFLAAIMLVTALPAIIFNGTNFFTGTVFSLGHLYTTNTVTHNGEVAPSGASYGALSFIIGTFSTSVIALLLAIPVSVGGVLMLTEWFPRRIQGFLSIFLELLAGIPSVVFGLWGITIFAPYMAQHVYPALSHIGTVIPWFKGPIIQDGEGLLSAALVLGIMVIPIIASTTRELVRQVPVLAREGALALGMTRYEMVRTVVIPYIRRGIFAASLLGWGRALGETIAVLLISGNALNSLPHSIFSPISTIAATIASVLDGALTDFTGMGIHALAELGLLLLIISLITNFAGRLVVRRLASGALPVGRGV
ncbi:MAG: phosphate ABC transporter permease subunit PstC [Candidatus Dormibacteraeota bacterium]|nr:phosphate ABC transporter permease subunit PstC [Candidatus Dormibacteraeota bacterium]MBV8444672.1 phosphate ABC transporter permease subunit PstC [Candidatus Dormibacteraeota bacterium]